MRSEQALRSTSRVPCSVLCSRSLICVISTTPFNTATPKSAMKPTPAEIENGKPRRASRNTPPVAANGTFRKMSAAGFSDPNVKYSMAKIRLSARGTTTPSLRDAASRFSNWPPQRM